MNSKINSILSKIHIVTVHMYICVYSFQKYEILISAVLYYIMFLFYKPSFFSFSFLPQLFCAIVYFTEGR